jgi:hypothetical protein
VVLGSYSRHPSGGGMRGCEFCLGAVQPDQSYIDKDLSTSLHFAQHEGWLSRAATSVAAGQIYLDGLCDVTTYQGPPMSLTALKDGSMALMLTASSGVGSAAGAFGTGALAATGAVSTALTAATFGIGAVVAIFSIIHAHHAAAVAREKSLVCTLCPSANYALQLIDQAVTTGQMTPAVASASLDKLHSDFVSKATGGPGGLQDVPHELNALAILARILQAIIDKKKDEYAAIAAQPAVTSSGPSKAAAISSGSVMVLPSAAAAAPAASPSWLPIAAVALIGFVLLKGL